MMYINFLVIKGACIKISAIKDDFLFENITLIIYYINILYNFGIIIIWFNRNEGCCRWQLQLHMAEKLAKPKVCPFSNTSRLCLSRVTHMSQSHAFCARKHWKIIKMDVCIALLLKMVSSVFGWVFSAADIEP